MMGSGWEELTKNFAALHHAHLCFKTVALHFQGGKCCIRKVFRAVKHRRTSTGMVLDRGLESDFQIVKTPFPQWGFSGRAGGIRTRGLLHPRQALYQAEPQPDF